MHKKKIEAPILSKTIAIQTKEGWLLLENLKYGSLSNAIRFSTEKDARQFLLDHGLDVKNHIIRDFTSSCQFLQLN